MELYGKLDPSIRHHIQKRGISIKQNTYIGFDTEFTSKGIDHNTLVSAQIAVNTKCYVQIPRVSPYTISMLDISTQKIIKQKPNSSSFNYKKIESSIQKCISSIRKVKYQSNDLSMLALSAGFRMVQGIKYNEQEEHELFSLPRTKIQPYIHYGSSFSLEELIKITSGLAKPFHAETDMKLMSLIREITSKCSNQAEITSNRPKQAEIRQWERSEDPEWATLPITTATSEILEDALEKRLSREYMVDLLTQKISITRTRNYYLIAHLTPADLSMLSDFDLVKEDLSIVNGSFVTLGKPLKYCGRNIHIRDTMLLAPGGSKSLASIGKLYGGVLNKIDISKSDLEDMLGFLKRDKAKFTEYALRDSLISLVHAG